MCEGEHKLKGNFENLIKEGVLCERNNPWETFKGGSIIFTKIWDLRTGLDSLFLLLHSSVPDPDPYVLGIPDPDPLVRGADPAPDPSIIKQK